MSTQQIRIGIEQIGAAIKDALLTSRDEKLKAKLREAMSHLKKAFQALEVEK